MKRVIVIVIDSMGIGAMPDCREYGDIPECNTVCNVAKAHGGLHAPNLFKLGLGNLADICGIDKNPNAVAQYGIMSETSKGKDTTTGHWEMMNIILDKPFKVYPNGFPKEIIDEFIEKTGFKLSKVEINDVEKETYYATIFLKNNNEEMLEIDSRPSDAIAIAIRAEAPIYVSAKVLSNGSVSTDSAKDAQEAEEFKDFIQNIKPSDFAKLMKDSDHHESDQ